MTDTRREQAELEARRRALFGDAPRTVERYWSYAKAWLFERIQK